jgi:putative ABC transport system permease protein
MLKNYFKIAWRTIQRNPVYSFINITGLAIALSCCMLIILYSRDEASFDRFHVQANHIYRLTYTMWNRFDNSQIPIGETNFSAGEAFKREIPEIASIVRLKQGNCLIKKGNETFNESLHYTDDNFFSVFSFPLTEGDAKTALTNPRSIVITEETAKKYFGTTHAIGRSLQVNLNGNAFETFIVSAVAKPCPENSSIRFTVLLPVSIITKDWMMGPEDWISGYVNTFILLKPDANPDAVQKKFGPIFQKYAGNVFERIPKEINIKANAAYGLQPLTAIHLAKDFTAEHSLSNAGNATYSYILSGISLFILIIACFNFVNITVAQSLKRAKEIGIRKVTGGRRTQLFAQFLSESLLVSLIAFILALVITWAVLPVFNQLANKKLNIAYLADGYLVAGYLTLLCVTTLMAGIYPGWILSGFNPIAALYNRLRFTGKHYFGQTLVVMQFVLSTILIIATITVYLQTRYLLHADLGYNTENMVRISLPRNGNQLLTRIENESKKYPGILQVTGRSGAGNMRMIEVNGKDLVPAEIKIDDHFLDAFQIPLVSGRSFSPRFAADTADAVLVNESFARKAGWENPLGQYFTYKGQSGKKYYIAGMVKDFHYLSLHKKIDPLVLHKYPDVEYNELWVKIQPAQIPATLALLEKIYKKEEPLYPFEYQFMNDLNKKQYESEIRWKQIISLSAAIAIFISCIGLFGLSALSMRQRTKEIGVRKVLGAPVQTIIRLLSINFCRLVIVAIVISFPVSWWAMNQWLQDFAYRIPMTWWIFSIAGCMVLFITLMTVGIQALKAALANPVRALRSE